MSREPPLLATHRGADLPTHVTGPTLTPFQSRFATGLAATAILFGISALVGWRLGAWQWLALHSEYVTTAPGTGMLAALLGAALLARAIAPTAPSVARLALGLAILVLGVAVAFALAERSGVVLPVERWFTRIVETRGGVRLGQTAFVTSALFALLSTGMILGQLRWMPSRWEARLHLLVVLIALVLVQGYLFGGPLMYGRGVIPVAALTALVILTLGLSALLLAGSEHWPVRLFTTQPVEGAVPGVRDARGFVLLLVLFVASSGYFWAVAEGDRVQARAERSLLTLANLKAGELAQWYEGFHSTARTAAAMPLGASALRDVQDTGTRTPATRSALLQDWMEALREESGVTSVAMFSPAGRMIANAPRNLAPLLSRPLPTFDPTTPHQVTSDLRLAGAGQAALSFWAPIRSPGPDPTLIAWLLFTVDADRTLFPLLTVSEDSASTLALVLWRIAADSAEIINPTLGADGAIVPPGYRVSLDSASPVPGVRGLLGEFGLLRGVGPHGVPVTSGVAPVPGTPWVLAARMDVHGLRGSVVPVALRATAISIIVALCLGMALLAAWSRRDLAAASRELHLVHEREASIEELRRSEERYALALKGTSDGLWDWDLATGEVYVSPHWAEMFGLTNTTGFTMSKDFFGRMHPDDHARAAAHLESHLSQGTQYSQEVRLRHDDGRYLWFWVRGEAFRDATGTPTRMAGSISDITARHEAEEALYRLDRILRLRSGANLALVRASSEGELLQEVTDLAVREGGFVMAWVGRAEQDGERLVRPVAVSGNEDGYLSEHPITWAEDDPRGAGPTGRCLRTGTVQAAQDLMSEQAFAPWRAAAIARGYAASCSIPLRVGNEMFGALMLYSREAYAFDAEEIALLSEIGNDVSFGLGAVRDHQAVEHQREELQLFREVMERSSDAIFITDAASGRFLAFNAAAPRWLGYSAEELRQMGPADVVLQVAGAKNWSTVVEQIRAEDSVVWPRTFRRKDGTSFPVEVALTAISTGDREVILSIARDISEREQLMNQLLRAQRMESVGRLAGGVAHDFNNLLTVINATVDMAMVDVGPNTPVYRDLAEIRGASDRAAALTRQLLAFSRQQVLHQAPMALNDLITGFLAMLRRVIGEDVVIEVDLADATLTVMADAGQLEQVLMNLSVNARDAMPAGGTLTIRTALVHLDVNDAARHDTMAPGDYALLSVTDTGLGMDRKVQAMIFEPFFTTKAPGKGTGLGLATVYGIIKQMGGGIWVESEVGVGSTFSIYLPLVAPATRDTVASRALQHGTGTETILVVEDEDAIRSVVRRVLERAGYTVLEADSGSRALALIGEREGPLDLVMTDLVMPGMTGVELAVELRRMHPELRILLTSGYSSDVVEGKIIPGVDWDFISKPYTAAELTTEIRRVLDTRVATDRA